MDGGDELEEAVTEELQALVGPFGHGPRCPFAPLDVGVVGRLVLPLLLDGAAIFVAVVAAGERFVGHGLCYEIGS